LIGRIEPLQRRGDFAVDGSHSLPHVKPAKGFAAVPQVNRFAAPG
jgi:hypothetical protein